MASAAGTSPTFPRPAEDQPSSQFIRVWLLSHIHPFKKCWQRELDAVTASIFQRAEHAALASGSTTPRSVCFGKPHHLLGSITLSFCTQSTLSFLLQNAQIFSSSFIYSPRHLNRLVIICCLCVWSRMVPHKNHIEFTGCVIERVMSLQDHASPEIL